MRSGRRRFTPFVEFLKQKNFVRAPIDLMHDPVCGHCGAAISILDVKQLAELAPTKVPPPRQLTPPRLTAHHADSPPTLIDLGLEAIIGWLGDILL